MIVLCNIKRQKYFHSDISENDLEASKQRQHIFIKLITVEMIY